MESFGSTFREKRIELGYTVKEVSGMLKINSRYLKCIENNKLQFLPYKIYAVFFIKSYAKLLEINPHPILSHLESHALFPMSYIPSRKIKKVMSTPNIKIVVLVIYLLVSLMTSFFNRDNL